MARERIALAALALALLSGASHSASAAERRGALRLLGTVVSSDPARSLAVVELAGASRTVRTGAELDGARVIEIRSESVLLRRGDDVETLDLASLAIPPSGGGGGSVFPASPDPALDSADPARTARSHSAHAQRSAVRAKRAPARKNASAPARRPEPQSEAEVARSNDELLADLAAQARFAPVMDNDGRLRGVAVMNVVPDSLIERLGLRSDDVIVAVNDTKIDSSGRAMNVARGLSRTAPVKLDIERRGVPTQVVVDPRSLQRR